MTIDARGKNCPIPVIMANKEIENNLTTFIILVDNDIAVENLKKLADSKGYSTVVNAVGSDYSVEFSSDIISANPDASSVSMTDPVYDSKSSVTDWVLFMGKDIIGQGDPVLGDSLIKMYFFTLSQETDLPKSILFMNSGVKLPTTNQQVIEHLKVLADKGCNILVCGACLDFYQLTDQLQVGAVSNMYAINQEILAAAKVVTL